MVPARPFSGSPGLCAVKRLDLALFVDRQDDGVCGFFAEMQPEVTANVTGKFPGSPILLRFKFDGQISRLEIAP